MDMTSLNLAENEIAFPGLGIDGITVNSVAFSLFGIDIAWYGIIIAAGMTLAIIFGLSQMKKFGIDMVLILVDSLSYIFYKDKI